MGLIRTKRSVLYFSLAYIVSFLQLGEGIIVRFRKAHTNQHESVCSVMCWRDSGYVGSASLLPPNGWYAV